MERFALTWYEAVAEFMPELPLCELMSHATDEMFGDYLATCEYVNLRIARLARHSDRHFPG